LLGNSHATQQKFDNNIIKPQWQQKSKPFWTLLRLWITKRNTQRSKVKEKSISRSQGKYRCTPKGAREIQQ
jgi:hypothetical protein